MVRASCLLLVTLALGPAQLVNGLAGCGTAAETLQCSQAYNTAIATARTAKDVAAECVAVAAWISCMTPSATCADAAKKTNVENEIATFKKQACVKSAAGNTGTCAAEPACRSTTTTVTPWDSSASSGDSGSGDSLGSSYSASLYKGSSGSDSSGSAGTNSSGSKASGSSGSYFELWQWIMLLLCCCCCICAGAGGAAMAMKKKPKKKSAPPTPPPMPEPVAAPIVEEAPPLEALEPLMPMAQTSSTIIPSYAPAATSYAYAQPTTSYAYAQPTTAYAQPMATAAYAQPTTAYAAPATYAGGYGGYPGTVV